MQSGWQCPVCGAGMAPWINKCDCVSDGQPYGYSVPDPHPCRECPNHPFNGGSGVCHAHYPYLHGKGSTCQFSA